jgi:hypothetical protein
MALFWRDVPRPTYAYLPTYLPIPTYLPTYTYPPTVYQESGKTRTNIPRK